MSKTLTDIALTGAGTPSGQWNVIDTNALNALSANDGDGACVRADAGAKDESVEFKSATLIGSVILTATLRLVARNELGAGQDLTIELHVFGQSPVSGADLAIPGSSYQEISRQVSLNNAYHTTGGILGTFGTKASHPGGARVTYALLDVEYSPPPNAPTLVSPVGSIGSLTPTMQTSVNNPAGGDTVTHTDIEVRRVSDNALMWASGFLAGTSIGYAGATLSNGVQYKWRARHRNTHGAVGAWSGFSNFTPTISDPPVATLVSPIGGAQVGTTTPTLTFNFSDPNPGDIFSAYQLQVRRVSDQVLFWDPGQVATTSGQQSANQASVVYAGTTLVAGTAYEWRARVQDNNGIWSNYTGWQSFTPAAAPDPPTISSPSGLTNTLTPTIQGTYNQGSGGSEAAYQYEVRQGTTTIYQSGDVAGAFGTGQAYGTDNPSDTPSAPPALAWGTSYQVRARSKDALGAYSAWTGWQSFHTNAKPTAPGSLTPNGAITGDTTPTLSWSYSDPDGDAQTEAEIELRKVSDDSVVTGYGPKTLVQSTQTHDVTETLTASPATEYKWRARVKGLAGPGFSDWSGWATFTVATAPQVSVLAPTPEQVVTAPAFTVQWSLTGGSGTQQDYRVKVLADDQSTVLHDSGVQAGTATSYPLPGGVLKNSGSYYIQVIAKDTLSQEAQSSLIHITTSWTPPATITGLSVVAVGSQS